MKRGYFRKIIWVAAAAQMFFVYGTGCLGANAF